MLLSPASARSWPLASACAGCAAERPRIDRDPGARSVGRRPGLRFGDRLDGSVVLFIGIRVLFQ